MPQRWQGSFVANLVSDDEDDHRQPYQPRPHSKSHMQPVSHTNTAIIHGDHTQSRQSQSQAHLAATKAHSTATHSERGHLPPPVSCRLDCGTIQCDLCRRLITQPSDDTLLQSRSAHRCLACRDKLEARNRRINELAKPRNMPIRSSRLKPAQPAVPTLSASLSIPQPASSATPPLPHPHPHSRSSQQQRRSSTSTAPTDMHTHAMSNTRVRNAFDEDFHHRVLTLTMEAIDAIEDAIESEPHTEEKRAISAKIQRIKHTYYALRDSVSDSDGGGSVLGDRGYSSHLLYLTLNLLTQAFHRVLDRQHRLEELNGKLQHKLSVAPVKSQPQQRPRYHRNSDSDEQPLSPSPHSHDTAVFDHHHLRKELLSLRSQLSRRDSELDMLKYSLHKLSKKIKRRDTHTGSTGSNEDPTSGRASGVPYSDRIRMLSKELERAKYQADQLMKAQKQRQQHSQPQPLSSSQSSNGSVDIEVKRKTHRKHRERPSGTVDVEPLLYRSPPSSRSPTASAIPADWLERAEPMGVYQLYKLPRHSKDKETSG